MIADSLDVDAMKGRAQAWCRDDPNERTAEYVQNLLDQATSSATCNEATQELESLFPGDNRRISFGTAGLRSEMKPGPLHMNDLVVVQAAQGLARYCLEENSDFTAQGDRPCAVVGYDHRSNPSMQLSSLSFAILTALVFRESGFDCLLLDGYVATPLVPFCLSQIKSAVVGVMITASHNPRQDAGYKVYWRDGCQIRSPTDRAIADSIEGNLRPWVGYRELVKARREAHPNDPCLGLSNPCRTEEMIEAYFDAIASSGLVTGQAKLAATSSQYEVPKFCYTA